MCARQNLGGAGSKARVRRVLLVHEQAHAKSEVLWRVHLGWIALDELVAGREACESEVTLKEQREGLERPGQNKSPFATAEDVDGQTGPAEEGDIFNGLFAILEFKPE